MNERLILCSNSSCHSGTALDLPYVYSTSGQIKEPSELPSPSRHKHPLTAFLSDIAAGLGKGLLGAGMSYARGDVGGMVKGLFSTIKEATGSNSADEKTKQTRTSGADVVMLSGCKDSQTSADATEAGKATGAMSYAFVKVLDEVSWLCVQCGEGRKRTDRAHNHDQFPQLTYQQMLNATRDVLVSKYSQKPQLSSSHPMDLNLLFVI